jgi:hypothetical protein
MWQHVVRNAFIQTDPHQLIETKGLKKRGRDDDHVSKLPLAKKTRLEAKGLKKQGRDDVDVSKQPLAKKTRLSWTLDLHQKFLSAVNHLGINSMNLSSLVFLFFAFVLYSIFQQLNNDNQLTYVCASFSFRCRA